MRTLAPIAFLSLLAVVGCDDGQSPVPVSGKVLLDGKPLSNASVVFEPATEDSQKGMGAWGKTDNDGTFVLRMIDTDIEGAVAGSYRVKLSTVQSNPESDLGPVSKELVPPHGRDGSMTFDVPPDGTDAADFALSSAPGR